MTQIIIKQGMFGSTEIKDQTFTMTKPPRTGKNGLYVTVHGSPVNVHRNIRIKISAESSTIILDDDGNLPSMPVVRTDDQIMDDMRERFKILDHMSHATLDGTVRGLIVTGPPGIGKSYGIEQICDEASVMITLQGSDSKVNVEKGSASAIGLYKLLYEYAAAGSVLVLDDSDTILYDETSLNLLKAAIDSGKTRRLSWRSESHALKDAGIPNTFKFKGSIIFVTNLDFEKSRGKIGAHLLALISRCHYLDMGISGTREKVLRCKQIVSDGMLSRYNFTDTQCDEIIDFIVDNQTKLREISLRMVSKIADLYKMDPNNWKTFANATCIRG
jgi:hypothetical protein